MLQGFSFLGKITHTHKMKPIKKTNKKERIQNKINDIQHSNKWIHCINLTPLYIQTRYHLHSNTFVIIQTAEMHMHLCKSVCRVSNKKRQLHR